MQALVGSRARVQSLLAPTLKRLGISRAQLAGAIGAFILVRFLRSTSSSVNNTKTMADTKLTWATVVENAGAKGFQVDLPKEGEPTEVVMIAG